MPPPVVRHSKKRAGAWLLACSGHRVLLALASARSVLPHPAPTSGGSSNPLGVIAHGGAGESNYRFLLGVPIAGEAIRRWYPEAGFVEQAFSSPGIGFYAVGVHQFTGAAHALTVGERLFTFNR